VNANGQTVTEVETYGFNKHIAFNKLSLVATIRQPAV
jgi:hypothetical protein